MQIVDNISEKSMKSTISLTAGRGRGKSAALGISIASAIVYGFSTGSMDWLYVYVKQYALWLMFYLPSTPGSSGIAEALYMAFYCESITPGMSGTAAFVWRFMSYYVYLFIGVLVFSFGRNGDMLIRSDANEN
jgi:uncharacterized protein (TIRG00374 family)